MRHSLRLHAHSPLNRIEQLLTLHPERVQALGAHYLVLDFDGVMASHGETEPLPEVLTWLRDFSQRWPQNRIAIFTNKPRRLRQLFFKNHFPDIYFIENAPKKPYPDGLIQLAEHWNTIPQHLLLVDDRWLTGGLAALLAGAQFLYIEKPYVHWRKRPLAELFFTTLRTIERKILI